VNKEKQKNFIDLGRAGRSANRPRLIKKRPLSRLRGGQQMLAERGKAL
jgi:hypothetical protein